jgi:hypothetical protein
MEIAAKAQRGDKKRVGNVKSDRQLVDGLRVGSLDFHGSALEENPMPFLGELCALA